MEQARGKVVLFLVVTMAPFAVLAPFIGPALDRVQQGRKYLLAGTLLARGLLCYAMAAAVSNPITLLPAAFGILVLQKAYGVVRASVAPRLLPEQITLVSANARSQLIAVITATLAAGLAEGIQVIGGAAWVLRVGMVIYLAAMVPALRLPDQVDSPPVRSRSRSRRPGPPPRPPPAAGRRAGLTAGLRHSPIFCRTDRGDTPAHRTATRGTARRSSTRPGTAGRSPTTNPRRPCRPDPRPRPGPGPRPARRGGGGRWAGWVRWWPRR